jgi:uncharacterized protein (DUF58 family)
VKFSRRAVSEHFGRRVREWARRRQGLDPCSLSLGSHRIYILPTREGLIFGAIVFTMLLGAMNYNNNMGFALTFLLAGIGIISIYQCHRNLADLVIHYCGAQAVFAGDTMQFRLVLENRGRKARWQIRAGWDADTQICDELAESSRCTLTLHRKTHKRGWLQVPRIQISTRFPLGLFRAWAWLNMNQGELVYPRPDERMDPRVYGASGRSTSGYDAGGDDDFSGFRDYRTGDPPKHVAWKAFARTGEMLVTEYQSGTQDLVWIDWDAFPGIDTEQRLARLARQVVDTENANHKYGLRLPGVQIEPAIGAQHRHGCLKQLALFGLPHRATELAGKASGRTISAKSTVAA